MAWKVHGKHVSYDKDQRKVLSWLSGKTSVTRIHVGPYRPARHTYAPATLTYMGPTPTSLRFRLYTGGGYSEVFVMCLTAQQEQLLTHVRERYPNNNHRNKHLWTKQPNKKELISSDRRLKTPDRLTMMASGR